MRLRLILFFLIGIACFILSYWALEPVNALRIYKVTAYPLTLFAYGCLIFGLVRSFNLHPVSIPQLLKNRKIEVLLFFLVAVVFTSQGPWGFITVSDEPLLVSTSQNLHFNRVPLFGWRAYNFEGTFTLLDSYLDKRPIPFSTLLSFVHDLTGYRVENAFALNAVLGLLCVALLGVLGNHISGRSGAIIGILAGGSLPVLQYYSHGGGFDVFHVAMILVVLYLGVRWFQYGDTGTFIAYIFAGVILCESRYEAAYYAIPIGLSVLLKWWKAKKVDFPWLCLTIPLILSLILFQQHVFEVNENFWELSSRPEADSIFGFHYFYPNLAAAIRYFFDFTEEYPNSPYISILGIAGFAFVLTKGITSLREVAKWSEEVWLWILFSLGLLAHFLLMMMYFYGQLDSGMLHRFSLPTYILAVLLILFFLRLYDSRIVRISILSVLSIGFVFYSIPVMATSFYFNNSFPSIQQKWLSEFVNEHKGENYLVIDRSPVSWIIRGQSSISYANANQNIQKISAQLESGFYDAVYIAAAWSKDVNNGELIFNGDVAPSEAFEVEVFEEAWLHPFFVIKVGKITSVSSKIDGDSSDLLNEQDLQGKVNLNEVELADQVGEHQAKKDYYRNLP